MRYNDDAISIRGDTMSENYIRTNKNGKKSVYYPESVKNYHAKVQQYKVQFSLSDDDRATVNMLNDLISVSGLSANAYIKNVLREHVNQKLQE